MKKQLLIDVQFNNNFTLLKESPTNPSTIGAKDYILRGILITADRLNRNKRIYPRTILEREVKKLQEKIANRYLYGELDHPDRDSIALQNSSHKIVNLWWEGSNVMGDIKLLETPYGKILKTMVDEGDFPGISARSLGSLGPTDNGGYIVQEDLDMITFDTVSDESNFNSIMKIRESKNKDNKEKLEKNFLIKKINEDIEMILCQQMDENIFNCPYTVDNLQLANKK